MNADIDFATGRFFLAAITDDGPSRIEGCKTYATWTSAENGVKDFVRARGPGIQVMIVEIIGTYWLDPHPAVLNNLPQPVGDINDH